MCLQMYHRATEADWNGKVQMPDDLKREAVRLDEEVDSVARKLDAHLDRAIKALCVPDSAPVFSRSAKAAHTSSSSATASAPKHMAKNASSSSTAPAAQASGSHQGTPTSVASTAHQQGRVVSNGIDAANSPAAKTGPKRAARNDFAAALQQAMAPKNEEPSPSPAAQHPSPSGRPSQGLLAKQWLARNAPGADFEVFDLDGIEVPAPDVSRAPEPSETAVQGGLSKQKRKRLKRQAQKMKAQMHAQLHAEVGKFPMSAPAMGLDPQHLPEGALGFRVFKSHLLFSVST